MGEANRVEEFKEEWKRGLILEEHMKIMDLNFLERLDSAMACYHEEIPAAKELPLFPTSPGIYRDRHSELAEEMVLWKGSRRSSSAPPPTGFAGNIPTPVMTFDINSTTVEVVSSSHAAPAAASVQKPEPMPSSPSVFQQNHQSK